MKALLLDLDGVLYEGKRAIAGAVEAVQWLTVERIPHRFVTNTTSRPRRTLVGKLAGFGITVHADDILTPATAATAWLARRGARRLALFVPSTTQAEFPDFEILPDDAERGADAVVIGDLGDGWRFGVLNRAFRLLMAEPHPLLVALGMTRYWQAPDGLRLDTAPFVAALEYASGVRASVLGKPAAPFFEAALARLGQPAKDVCMVGDDIVTDVGAAQALGLVGALVKTGKFRPADLDSDIHPDAVLDSIAALPDWWARHRD
jgi:phospholysine phosphohistidine inorganic pyrophosphate phosphatase